MQTKNSQRKNNTKNIRPATSELGESEALKVKVIDEITYDEVGQDDFDHDNGEDEEKIDYDFRILVRIELSKAYRFKRDMIRYIKGWD